MKFVSEFALRPGSQTEYRRRHDEIWPEMLELISQAGIENYSIWNKGTQLIEYFETEDPERVRRVLAESPVKARWDAYMSDILVFGSSGAMEPLTMMFQYNGKEPDNGK